MSNQYNPVCDENTQKPPQPIYFTVDWSWKKWFIICASIHYQYKEKETARIENETKTVYYDSYQMLV